MKECVVLFVQKIEYTQYVCVCFFAVALRLNAGHGLLILEVSRSHTTMHRSR